MKNRIVKILVGVPGSGKSTWALDFVKNNPGWVRVNRDAFREMIKGSKIDFTAEKAVTEMQDAAILAALKAKKNVIVDNTHCKLSYLNHIIFLVQYYADVEVKFFETEESECIRRDSLREQPVGEHVIKKMSNDLNHWIHDNRGISKIYKKNRPIPRPSYEVDPTRFRAAIFDIDGTIALMKDRSPYDWKKVGNDEVNRPVASLISMYRNIGYKIVLLSGRDGSCRKETEKWCSENEIYYSELFMRETDDFRKDSIIKKEIYTNKIEPKYDVKVVFDDRLQVIKMWNEMGLFVFNVNQGMIDF